MRTRSALAASTVEARPALPAVADAHFTYRADDEDFSSRLDVQDGHFPAKHFSE